MGGTELFAPLNDIYKLPATKDFNRQIFVLTDGAIFDTDVVINLIRENKKSTRVHMIGIGNGASSELIKGGAQAGDGQYYFIYQENEIKAKIIEALSSSVIKYLVLKEIEITR